MSKAADQNHGKETKTVTDHVCNALVFMAGGAALICSSFVVGLGAVNMGAFLDAISK